MEHTVKLFTGVQGRRFDITKLRRLTIWLDGNDSLAHHQVADYHVAHLLQRLQRWVGTLREIYVSPYLKVSPPQVLSLEYSAHGPVPRLVTSSCLAAESIDLNVLLSLEKFFIDMEISYDDSVEVFTDIMHWFNHFLRNGGSRTSPLSKLDIPRIISSP